MLGLTGVCFEKDRPYPACQARKHVGTTHQSKKKHDNVKTTGTPPYGSFLPVTYLSIGGSKYGLVIADDFSRFTWVFFLQDKS